VDLRAEWEEVFQTGDQVEAEVVRGLLVTSDIPVVVEYKGWKSMQTFFGSGAPGQLVLKVPPDQAALARELLASKAEFADPEAQE